MLPLRGVGRGRGRRWRADRGPLGPPACVDAGRGAPPSPVALITFVLVLREGETLVRPAWGWGEAQARIACRWGEEGGRREWGQGETGRGAVSFGSEADQ